MKINFNDPFSAYNVFEDLANKKGLYDEKPASEIEEQKDIYDLDVEVRSEAASPYVAGSDHGGCTGTCYVAVCSNGCHHTTQVRCTD